MSKRPKFFIMDGQYYGQIPAPVEKRPVPKRTVNRPASDMTTTRHSINHPRYGLSDGSVHVEYGRLYTHRNVYTGISTQTIPEIVLPLSKYSVFCDDFRVMKCPYINHKFSICY